MKSITQVLFILNLFCSTGFTQKISSLHLTIGSGLSYRSLSNLNNSLANDTLINISSTINSKRRNWLIGVNVYKILSDKFYLKTGL